MDNATCKFNQKNRIFLNREAGMGHMLTGKDKWLPLLTSIE